MEDLSCDSVPLGPFESPSLILTVCMHYACPLHSTVTGDHLSIMEIIWVMRIKSSPLKFSGIWSVEHLSWCWSYSLGTTGDKPCREYFLLTLSRAVFKQFLRRFCSNDSLKLFSQIPLLHFAFSSNNAASCFSNSYPSETVGHCRPIKQFCAINDKWCWEKGPVQVRRESEVRPVREQVLFASTKHTLPQSPSSSWSSFSRTKYHILIIIIILLWGPSQHI